MRIRPYLEIAMNTPPYALRCFAAITLFVAGPGIAMAGWTPLPVRAGLQPYVDSARVCKRTIGSIYGPLYTVNYQVFRKSPKTTSIGTWSYRVTNGNSQLLHSQSNNQWLFGTVSGTGDLVYTSPFHNDNYGFDVRFAAAVWDAQLGIWIGGATLAQLHPSQIANC